MANGLYREFSGELTKRAIDFVLGREEKREEEVVEGEKHLVMTAAQK